MPRAALLVALLLAGCAVPPDAPPPAAGTAAALDRSSVSFELVTFLPSEPRFGQEVLVRARVSPPGFEDAPRCAGTVGQGSYRGAGGGGSGGTMREVEPYVYECVILLSDFTALVLLGHDGERHVRSELFVLRAPDAPNAGRPASRIASLAFENASNGDLVVTASTDAATTNPLGLTTGVLQVERLVHGHRHMFSSGHRFEPAGPGRLVATYPATFSESEPTAAGLSEDHVMLGFAYTYNQLDGFDVSPLLEISRGACAAERCVRT